MCLVVYAVGKAYDFGPYPSDSEMIDQIIAALVANDPHGTTWRLF